MQIRQKALLLPRLTCGISDYAERNSNRKKWIYTIVGWFGQCSRYSNPHTTYSTRTGKKHCQNNFPYTGFEKYFNKLIFRILQNRRLLKIHRESYSIIIEQELRYWKSSLNLAFMMSILFLHSCLNCNPSFASLEYLRR